MKVHLKVAAILCLCALLAPSSYGQDNEKDQKLAQTGMKFLSRSVSPRGSAMADAVTAEPFGSSAAMFYNPASMARLDGTVHAFLGQVQWIADIDYQVGSVAFRPLGGRLGVFGVSVMAVDYGTVRSTIRADNDKGYLDMGTLAPSAMSVGFGYARALTDRFSVGGNVKYVRESLGSAVIGASGGSYQERDYAASSAAFDFGVVYRTGFRSLTIGMSARNFAPELSYVRENFELPLTFRIGASMDLIDFTSLNPGQHAFRVGVDARRPRDFAEQVKIGGEYLFMNTFALRAGYTLPTDEEGLNLGAGVQTAFGGVGFGFDYAYTQFGIFGNVNRIAAQLSF